MTDSGMHDQQKVHIMVSFVFSNHTNMLKIDFRYLTSDTCGTDFPHFKLNYTGTDFLMKYKRKSNTELLLF